ncbi:FAD-dependent oxidoreductase [Nonomuraea turcica]|jgi:2-polyprenyl-6-methoxyphenol hydroxylase-like FAD-dependent oxidoreductase|uniref:FAD-dependent oxidoreductase n=1 Tax=Nonomuraea sp. G32 TaxID=3067274 RepID=UPI00273C952F|nr:FAD-dependent oxidoreductase [Nonomuraea sp. G32]MDP4506897.1 FAD-dependent oxidoreductase [Nonomuraea sp. G32]
MATTSCDVAIVGAGLGGCFLALLLARRGRRVVVIEQGPSIPSAGADFLKPPGLRVLARHGLANLVERHGLRRDIIRYYHDGDPIRECRFPDGGFLIRPYKELVELIYTCCAMEGVDFWFDADIADIAVGDDRVEELILSDGRRLRADVVIGADGTKSAVRQALGIEQVTMPYERLLMRVATVPLTASVARLNRLYFSSDGWLTYLYPLNRDQARVFVGLPPDDDKEIFQDGIPALIDELKKFVTDSSDAFNALQPAKWQLIKVSSLRVSAYHKGNAALLGSAAFACHPMTGMGMSYTLHDAEILADVISAAGGDAELLDRLLYARYEPRRHAHRELIDYGDALAATFRDRDAYLAAFRPDLHIYGEAAAPAEMPALQLT